MVTQGPDDPMCCPTQRVVKTCALKGDQLVETGSQTIASSSDSGLESVGSVWQWTKFLEANANKILVDDPENYIIEFMPAELCDSALRKQLVAQDLELHDGVLKLPEEPGLGIELNAEALSRFAAD